MLGLKTICQKLQVNIACKNCLISASKLALRLCSNKSGDHDNTNDVKQLISSNAEYEVSTELEQVDFPSDFDLLNKEHVSPQRDQTAHSFRPKVDPTTTSILLFSGQGSQFVGMGRELLEYPEAKELFTIASDYLRYDLLKLCLDGPIKELNRTEICQPATFVASVGALVKLRERHPQALENCVATAGFSVGEYAALVFAGALSFEDALKVVHTRAVAMQEASDSRPGGLMTVFMTSRTKLNYAMLVAREFCAQRREIENPVCSVANYLFANVAVVGGDKEALKFIQLNKDEFHIKRVKELPVSGAFHTKLMKPAVSAVADSLNSVQLQLPVLPVHSNVNSKPYRAVKHIIGGLKDQLWKPVKWEQTMHALYQRKQDVKFPRTYALGPGTDLETILRVVNRKAYQSSFTRITV